MASRQAEEQSTHTNRTGGSQKRQDVFVLAHLSAVTGQIEEAYFDLYLILFDLYRD